jgi:hypothetical protein
MPLDIDVDDVVGRDGLSQELLDALLAVRLKFMGDDRDAVEGVDIVPHASLAQMKSSCSSFSSDSLATRSACTSSEGLRGARAVPAPPSLLDADTGREVFVRLLDAEIGREDDIEVGREDAADVGRNSFEDVADDAGSSSKPKDSTVIFEGCLTSHTGSTSMQKPKPPEAVPTSRSSHPASRSPDDRAPKGWGACFR